MPTTDRARAYRTHAAPEVLRSEMLRVRCRPAERAMLQAIADGWGCPLGTAAWALLSAELARLRRQAPDVGADLSDRLARIAAGGVTRRRRTAAAESPLG